MDGGDSLKSSQRRAKGPGSKNDEGKGEKRNSAHGVRPPKIDLALGFLCEAQQIQ